MGIPVCEYYFDFSRAGSVFWSVGARECRREDAEHSREYFIDDSKITTRFGHCLDPLLADWVDVALSVYLADRLAPRRDPANPYRDLQWQRSLNVTIPVRTLEIWRSPAVKRSLNALLRFLTEDGWRVRFRHRTCPGRASETQGHLFPGQLDGSARVSLFSGGLDSFAGTIRELLKFAGRTPVLVSGITHTRQRAQQREQVAALAQSLGSRILHVAVPYGLQRKARSRGDGCEPSQRTRGFLYLTLGAVTALAVGAQELSIYENGIGALNLPYDGSQLGTSNSRAVHPITLLLMEDFIAELTGRQFHIRSPFIFSTKAQMCAHSDVQTLKEYLPRTFSCDSFPLRVRGKPQCGFCTSCLLRRLSLERAALAAFDSAGYLHDLLSPLSKLLPAHLHPFRAMEWQSHKLREALKGVDQWLGLIQRFVELEQVEAAVVSRDRSPNDLRRGLIGLYSQYLEEWSSFSARQIWLRSRLAA